MSTPGRKRVQPILIDDDDEDDIESTSTNEVPLVSSPSSSFPCTASKENLDPLKPSFQSPTLDSSSLSLNDSKGSNTKKQIYVALHFDELSHIRNVQTNGEFVSLLYDFKLYKNVVNGQICFSCRKVKFSIFQAGCRCAICLQRICEKCQRHVTSRSPNICIVSLNLLRRSSTTTMATTTNEITLNQTHSESSSSLSTLLNTTTNKTKGNHRRKNSTNSFSCCIDCFILFDPNSLVQRNN